MIRPINIGSLTVNRACDNRCASCYAQGTGFLKEEMSVDLARRLILICKDCGVKSISILGGEPSLYPYLVDVINIINGYGMIPSIITNGRRFSNKKFTKDISLSGLKNINVSVKAGSKEDYISFTGADGYGQMIHGFRNLQDVGFDPSVSVTFNRTLFQSHEKIIETIVNMNAKKVAIEFCNPIIVDNNMVEADAPSPKEIAIWTKTLFPLLLSMGIDFAINPNIPLCLFNKEELDGMIAEDSLIGGCHMRCGNVLIFLPNGDLIPCHQFTNHILAKYGKDFSDSVSFIYFVENDPDVTEFYNLTSLFPVQKCVDCAEWKRCGGGCVVKSFHYPLSNYIF